MTAMRRLIAMALIGAGAMFFSASTPVQAMTASGAGAAKLSDQASNVQEVRHRWRHRYHRRHYGRHYGWYGYRRYHRRHYYYPYSYYGGGYGYGYRYWHRPRFGIYFRL
jgi:hypothetical protein